MLFKFESSDVQYSVIPLGLGSLRIQSSEGESQDFFPETPDEMDSILPGPILVFTYKNGNECSILQKRDKFYLHWNGNTYHVRLDSRNLDESVLVSNEIRSPMPGKILKIYKSVGDTFEKSEVLGILEAMKMENTLKAGFAGKVISILKKEGEIVSQDEVLMILEPLP